MARFTGKRVIVTGAAAGLGLETAHQLAREGARLVLVDRDPAGLASAVASLAQSKQHICVVADVSREAEVRYYVSEAMAAFGGIDGFFNNAGVEGRQNPTEAYGADEFTRVLGINLDGAFYGLAAVLAVMREQGHGAIVNTASVGGIRGIGNQSGYAASKHGVIGLTRNSAIEYGQYGIQVNAIAPGAIMTAMVEGALRQRAGDDWEAAGRQYVLANPMKRFGRSEEVAALVCFLLSGEAQFINGAVIPIDGGQSTKY